jgi:starvation-inducible DNA-binding protein
MGQNRKDGQILKQQILIQPNIGLDGDVRRAVIEILNNTLANEIVLSQKTRSAYWNASGSGFMELHTLFESEYQQLSGIADNAAQRIRMLGGVVIGSMQALTKNSRLEEQLGQIPDILHLLADHEACIRYMREDARKCAIEFEDEGTFDMLVSAMSLHEKTAWMLRSYIESKPMNGDGQKREPINE